ncbi:unnamed protein product [Rotaria magnacalcarata]|uniref:Uncharacterized protein n=2 Tax=Rotaria magnacalcarata TaxID=392030 RepID=A0A814T011_9BILA|nr:unnamed protein product [Rotaria magnacalcarata]CAF2129956.1 unnamed protein product [Rotaria magnacalcarata]CAF3808068.1 unnamed protein product [Rotaria magnacalcarata]CAF3849797.1 unnamed protein product [Rotaria magnacalcarata]
MNNSCTITRYYGSNEKDLEKLRRFIEQAQTYSNRILIGVDVEKDLTDCIQKYAQQQKLSNIPVDFIPIQPWIGISSPLNILLNHLSLNQTTVLIQSVEIQCTSYHVDRLRAYLQEDNILCAGAVLDGHHVSTDSLSYKKYVPLHGDTSPWNTFILWNLEKLRRTGFPMCADFVNPPGMEDSAAIGLQQKLFGGMKKNRALLIHFNDNVQWLNQFDDDQERHLKHQLKMKSKNSRTQQLLQMLDLSDSDQEVCIGIEYINEKLCQ